MIKQKSRRLFEVCALMCILFSSLGSAGDLPAGNILVTYVGHWGGTSDADVEEITYDGSVVWKYPEKLLDINAFLIDSERLTNCNTILVFGGPHPKLLEIDYSGNPVWELELKSLAGISDVDVLANGNFLVGGAGKQILEIDREGNIVRNVTLPGGPSGVTMLDNGDMLVAIYPPRHPFPPYPIAIETNWNGDILWSAPESTYFQCGDSFDVDRRPNGNIIISCFNGIVEINPDPTGSSPGFRWFPARDIDVVSPNQILASVNSPQDMAYILDLDTATKYDIPVAGRNIIDADLISPDCAASGSTTTTTLAASVPEFTSIGVLAVVMLTAPGFMYLLVKRRH